jgi:hypothetical protein
MYWKRNPQDEFKIHNNSFWDYFSVYTLREFLTMCYRQKDWRTVIKVHTKQGSFEADCRKWIQLLK